MSPYAAPRRPGETVSQIGLNRLQDSIFGCCRYGRGTAPIQPQNAPGRRGGAGHRAVGLDEWLARFEQLGIRHSPIAEREYGAVLTFKDPDGIQFAMFLKADDP